MVLSKKGAIVVVDALGTKGKWMSKTYEKSFNDIINTICNANTFMKDLKEVTSSPNDFMFTFSDTLICVFEGKKDDALKKASYWSTYLVSTGIQNQIFFRGALGYGEFFLNPYYNVVVGPTIDEVSEWHDKGLFIGVYTAPSANFYDYDGLIHGDLGNPFTKYQIKMKDNVDYRCWVTNWPRILSRSLELIGEPNSHSIDSDTHIKTKFECNLSVDAFQKINYAMEFYEKQRSKNFL